jgi:glycerol uptake facilitator protein
MKALIGEFLGTSLLILLGNGVVANVLLKDSKGQGGGWIVITFGWSMAVFVAVYATAAMSGAHLNPAVSLALCISGKFAWSQLLPYMFSQLMGAMFGSLLVWLTYKQHFEATSDAALIKACFCTAPAIRSYKHNFLTEFIATFAFIMAVLYLAAPEVGLGALDALPVALVVFAIGLSLGGPTGYAINPVRDFGPRLMHALLPFHQKADSDWAYAPIPIFAPLCGAAGAAIVYYLLELI